MPEPRDMKDAMPPRERVVLVGIEPARRPSRRPSTGGRVAESLEELESLARSAGADVAAKVVQRRSAPDAAWLVGAGKLEELRQKVGAEGIDAVIVDHDLTPTQLRNLEDSLECKVLDRTQLILDIFARRARTREGQLQVEMAQLNYLLPRLSGRGTTMSRLGGGIGTRGPGETQLETDRRRIARRIRKIREQLAKVRSSRLIQRRQRVSVPLPALAFVGYTNAGKSTLFNRVTGAGVYADDRLFATLDPTVRLFTLPSRRQVVLSDTVGFIRNLPTTLVQAFRATLEEVAEAALLLHVLDVSSPVADQQGVHVFQVLHEIGAASVPQLLVLNKIDRLEGGVDAGAILRRLVSELPSEDQHRNVCGRAVAVSAKTGEGIEELTRVIDEILLLDPVRDVVFRFPLAAGHEFHLLYERGQVRSKTLDGETWRVEATVPESVADRLRRFLERRKPEQG